jgi:sacsin
VWVVIPQNAKDNEYPPNVELSLEFVITTREVTCVCDSSALLVFNNELGFTKNNIEYLDSVELSTKKSKRQGGYIGKKGNHFSKLLLGK